MIPQRKTGASAAGSIRDVGKDIGRDIEVEWWRRSDGVVEWCRGRVRLRPNRDVE
jgi:hypothetical protein